jgi:cytosine/adenosine deaminase-related metal-dependent hydrolase
LKRSPIRKVCFAELLSIADRPPRTPEELSAVMEPMAADDRLIVGVSPHAPYSVREDHLRACFALAAERGLPVTTHWSECRSEVEFLAGRPSVLDEYHRMLADGPFASPKMRPLGYLQSVSAAGQRILLGHLNYLDPAEMAVLAESAWSVAYCPRTHDFFHHEDHAFREMLAAGVNVCAATDSLASNPSLSVLAELRFLRRRHRDLEAATLLAMGTINGARGLGLDSQIGSIEAGKWADLAAIPLSDPTAEDPLADLLDGEGEPTWVMVGGDVVAGSEFGDET